MTSSSLPPPGWVDEVLAALQSELKRDSPAVASVSIHMGLLQDRLLGADATEAIPAAAAAYLQRFREQLLAPAAARAAKAASPADKVVAIAKALWTKLAKAPAHKQPLHQQYLTSALRPSGKRQLDCLGIATAVLALCQELSRPGGPEPSLAAAQLVVSDDHCWLRLPGQPPSDIEVTDCRVLAPAAMGGWLYAGGRGVACSARQVALMCVAAMSPEEMEVAPRQGKEGRAGHGTGGGRGGGTAAAAATTATATAAAVRAASLQLLQALAAEHPGALLYSTRMRWGMLLEAQEVLQLEAAHERGDCAELRRLTAEPRPPSVVHYQAAMDSSTGHQFHPASCLLFTWFNRLQAVLWGAADGSGGDGGGGGGDGAAGAVPGRLEAKTAAAGDGGEGGRCGDWRDLQPGALLEVATVLMERAAAAVAPVAAVLHRYEGRCDRQRDQVLGNALTDVLENMREAAQDLAELQRDVGRGAAAAAGAGAGGGCDSEAGPAVAALLAQQQQGWLQATLQLLDAVCVYTGEEQALAEKLVDHFLAAAACYSRDTRAAGLAAALEGGLLRSDRLARLVSAGGWPDLGPEVKQAVQMPASRKRRRT